jgi:hypothetical protein
MAYTSVYDTEDMTEISIDILSVALIVLIGFVAIAVLVMVIVWARNTIMNKK